MSEKKYVDLLLIKRFSDDRMVGATAPCGKADVDDIVNVDGELGLVVEKQAFLEMDNPAIHMIRSLVNMGSVYAVYSLYWTKGGEQDA